MSEDIDELFGGGTGQPVPRYGLINSLLFGGTALAFFGLICNAAPGGLMVLLSWTVLETELDRVESGYLPLSERPRLTTLKLTTQFALAFIIFIFALQMVLYCTGGYDWLWGQMLSWFVSVVEPWMTTAES